jgi:hypothetical protein
MSKGKAISHTRPSSPRSTTPCLVMMSNKSLIPLVRTSGRESREMRCADSITNSRSSFPCWLLRLVARCARISPSWGAPAGHSERSDIPKSVDAYWSSACIRSNLQSCWKLPNLPSQLMQLMFVMGCHRLQKFICKKAYRCMNGAWPCANRDNMNLNARP